MIRKLEPIEIDLLRQAFDWREEYPSWFRTMLAEGAPDQSWEGYLQASREMVDFGIFEGEMYGLISIRPCGNSRYEAHIAAKRGSDLEKLAFAAYAIRDALFRQGAKEIIAWVASQHRSMKRLCRLAGLEPDTLTVIRGEIRNRLITWERFSARPEVCHL